MVDNEPILNSASQLSADLAAVARDSRPEQIDVMSRFGQVLAQLIDAASFPTLCGMLAAGVFDQPDDPDEEFNFGLRMVLDGVALLVEERHAANQTPQRALRGHRS